MGVVEATEQTRSGKPLLSLLVLSGLVPELRSELEDGIAWPGGQKREYIAQVGRKARCRGAAASPDARARGLSAGAGLLNQIAHCHPDKHEGE
jgi:hypothetical protein